MMMMMMTARMHREALELLAHLGVPPAVPSSRFLRSRSGTAGTSQMAVLKNFSELVGTSRNSCRSDTSDTSDGTDTSDTSEQQDLHSSSRCARSPAIASKLTRASDAGGSTKTSKR